MKSWEERLIGEYMQLHSRLRRLKVWNEHYADGSTNISETEHKLLVKQEGVMQMYLDCLKKRIQLHGLEQELLDKARNS